MITKLFYLAIFLSSTSFAQKKSYYSSPDYSKSENPKELSEFFYNYEKETGKSFFVGKPNFAKHYEINFVDNPSGKIGKMLDSETGIVYSLPDQLKTCQEYTDDLKQENVIINSTEITFKSCDPTENKPFYYTYKWNEDEKNFAFISKKQNNDLRNVTIDIFWNYLSQQTIANKNLDIPVNSLAKMLSINLSDQIDDDSEGLKNYLENKIIDIDVQLLSKDYYILITGFGNSSSSRTNIFKKNSTEYELLDINRQLRKIFSRLSAKGFRNPEFESCYQTSLRFKKYLVLEVRTDTDPGCCTSLRLLVPLNELKADPFASQNILYGVSNDGSIENIKLRNVF